jgi:hypothetical protein
MRKVWCILVFSVASGHAYGQAVAGGLQSKGIDLPTSNNSFITQLPRAAPEVEGNVYLADDYLPGKIELKNGMIVDGHSFRYNLKEDMLEIMADNQIRVLRGERVKAFSWRESESGATENFVSSLNYALDNVPQIGFVKVLADGDWQLLSKYFLVVSKGQYVEALDAGIRDTKISKKETFFFSHDGNLIATTPKKDFIDRVGDDDRALAAYMKDKKLSTKSVVDLKAIHSFLNRPHP